MIIELEINGARVIISGDNLTVNVTQDSVEQPKRVFYSADRIELPTPDQIKALRKARGLSQAALAKLVGTSQANIHRWETGEVQPRVSCVNALVELMNGVAQ